MLDQHGGTVEPQVQVALSLVRAINAHDPNRILAIMSARPVFLDSLGASVRGRPEMRRAWVGYFGMVPDYRIQVTQVLATGSLVALFGWASGTYSTDGKLRRKNRWKTPAAWTARVKRARVLEWRVYADNEPIRRVMRAASE